MSINKGCPFEAPPTQTTCQCSLRHHELCRMCLSLNNYSWNLPDVFAEAASLRRSCWSWPAVRTPGRGSAYTAPRRRTACPASAGRTHKQCWSTCFSDAKANRSFQRRTTSSRTRFLSKSLALNVAPTLARRQKILFWVLKIHNLVRRAEISRRLFQRRFMVTDVSLWSNKKLGSVSISWMLTLANGDF